MLKFREFKKNIFERTKILNKSIIYVAFLLLFFGLFLTLAASPSVAERNHYEWTHFFVKHVVFIPIAIGTMFFISLLPLKVVRLIAFMIFTAGIFGMIFVLLGPEIKGARRWINFFGIGIQPSEFVKPSFAVIIGWLLAKGRLTKNKKNSILAFILLVLTVALLLLQPDLGMTLTILGIFAAELFLSGISWFLIFGLGGGVVGLVLFAFFAFDHVHARILRFLNPQNGESYQVEKSLESLKSAGWFGVGPGEGNLKSVLPDAHTDFIMAVSAEEFGFIITAIIICTFMFLTYKCISLIRKENNLFIQLATSGLMTQITFQALVNISSTLNLIPTKGMTLPFISYGGSSLVSIALAFGFILALTRSRTFSRGLE